MNQAYRLPSLRGNVLALGMVQASNYIIPLLLLPFLTRVLGVESFGKVVFAQVLMAYVLLIVDFGFSWSATRQVSANRADPISISRIFMATWMAQWILFLMCLALLFLLVFSIESLWGDVWLYTAAVMSVLGNLLFPVWFLQGLECLKAVAFAHLFIRILGLIPVFLFVSQPEHGLRFLIITGTVATLGGALVILWIYRQKLVIWKTPQWVDVYATLRNGVSLFGSRLSISLYTNLVPLALGLIVGPVALAQFNVADKLRSAGQGLMGPIAQAIFPRMSHLVTTDKTAAFSLIKISFALTVTVGGSASLLLWFCADSLVLLLGGEDYAEAALILRWLAPLPLIIGLSNIFGIQIMLPKMMTRPFNLILLLAAVIGSTMIWPMAKWYGAMGAAQTILIIELFVTAAMGIFLWRNGCLAKEFWRNG
jgi:O-antigen/teichoic acid export membrane protein